jgi:hypothetical protein
MKARKIEVGHLSEELQKSYSDMIQKHQDGRDDLKLLRKEYNALKAGIEKVEKNYGGVMHYTDVIEKGSEKSKVFSLVMRVKHKYEPIEHNIRMYKDWEKVYIREIAKLRKQYISPYSSGNPFSSCSYLLDTVNGKITLARKHARIANDYLIYLNDAIKSHERDRLFKIKMKALSIGNES